MPDEIRIHVRISEELKARVKAICEEGVDEAKLVRACLEAVADYYDEHGEITLPLSMLPRSVAEKIGLSPPKKSKAASSRAAAGNVRSNLQLTGSTPPSAATAKCASTKTAAMPKATRARAGIPKVGINSPPR